MYYGDMRKKPLVSVVIASHRQAMLPGLLHSLLQQNPGPVPFEVIVITDFPNGQFQNDFAEVQWGYVHERSISAKRNTAAALAKAPVLAFIDDDCIAAPDWVEKGYAYLSENTAVAAVEGTTTIGTAPGVSRQATREYRRLEKPGYRTNNLFFRTAVFREIGGFDERFSVQREDIDLAFTALEQGYVFGFGSDIRVTHRYRTGEKWDLLKNCWNRRFDPLLFRKHSGRYMKMVGFPLPPTQLLLLLLHLFVLAAFGRRRLIAVAAAVDTTALSALGLRRSGVHPEKWLYEVLQLAVAPVVTIAALLYGWVRIR